MSPHAPRANRIVHIGPGAFHRAHQAVYTHDAMPADGGAWGITAVSLRSTKIADALNAQNGRYTVVTRAASGPEYRVIESITDAVTAAQGLAPVLEALAAPCTRIISLTVTEKAYQPGQSADDMNVIRVLTEALARRKAAGLAGVTLLSCDNLPNNGAVLRSAVLGEARARDPRLADWIERHASFPSTMVDRITPATTPALLDMVAHDTGWADLVPVETEPFSQWIIEDAFVQGRPAWDTAGALLVGDVKPYENMKLRMLNGAHSMLAYAGHLTGKTYVRDVMAEAPLAARVAEHIDAAAATLIPVTGVDFARYRDALLARFRTPHIAHETVQIAMDGSQKMPPRIFTPAREAISRGQSIAPFARPRPFGFATSKAAPMRGTPIRCATRARPSLRRFPSTPRQNSGRCLPCLTWCPPRLRKAKSSPPPPAPTCRPLPATASWQP